VAHGVDIGSDEGVTSRILCIILSFGTMICDSSPAKGEETARRQQMERRGGLLGGAKTPPMCSTSTSDATSDVITGGNSKSFSTLCSGALSNVSPDRTMGGTLESQSLRQKLQQKKNKTR